MTAIPHYAHDLFTADVLAEPYEHYRALRELGPVVWLDAHQVYALPRYAEVRAALSTPATFCSSRGVGLNDIINAFTQGSALTDDGELHDRQRAVLSRRLAPRALRAMREAIQERADELVDQLVARGSFDAAVDLARALPLSVVPDLAGWPEDARDKLLDWASATFDVMGPLNARTEAAFPRIQEMATFASCTAAERSVLPGSAADDVLTAFDRGELQIEDATSILMAYIGPSMDTTISAIGSAVWLLGTHPDQWEALRGDHGLVPNAFNEVVRMESPVSGFTRVLTTDTSIGGYDLPENARVLLMFASANRDERRWDQPDTFDVTRRDAGQHVGFGYGLHACVGQGLARLEGEAVLGSLVRRVETFDLKPPVLAFTNIVRSIASMPMTVQAADQPASSGAQQDQN
jgi:cytochrome P450